MIPILYEGNETNFTSNGLGRLADAISCKVVEERNATYELEMTYPVSGVHFNDITENRIILAQPFDGGQTQPFIIYKVTKPLNGIVTVNAEHISYRLSGMVVMPFTANSPQAALSGLKTYSAVTNPFNFSTDKSNTGNFTVSVPTSARELMCGSSGSILDVYGKADYEFDRFNVFLRVDRGSDNGVTLRYGKNITELSSVLNTTGVYTGIAPYWSDGQGTIVTLPENVILSEHTSEFPYKIIKSVDFSEKWENAPTVAQLREAAQAYVANNEGWKVTNNITVSFVALWNTEEYKEIAPLERVKMCDIVHIKYSKLGIDFTTKVVKTDYDVLQEKYNAITLGDTYYTLSTVFNEEIQNAQEEQSSHMQKAIAHATALITGGLGGHVVFNLNADGEPQEILIMDTDNMQTAVSVIRMNKNGIGFSTNGYNGPFHTAWTIDGHFVADYIDSGTLNADIIKAGMLQDEAGLNYWDMRTGDFRLTSGAKIGDSDIASTDDVSDGVSAAEDYADNGITLYDVALNQVKVFNKLTNNGAAKGIYMTSNQLYINADYVATGILTDVKGLNFWNLNTGDFQLRQGAKIGTSTVASASDVSAASAATLDAAESYADGAVEIYDNALNQQKVFNKLTKNGTLKGIYMSSGELYINGTYIKTGVLDASLITAGIIQDKKKNNYWNMVTGEFKLSATSAKIEGSPIATTNDVSSAESSAKTYADNAVSSYDTSLNQQKVFNKLTNNGKVQGIYLQDGNLYINGTYIQTGTIDASKATITNLNASNIKSGTLSASRIAANSISVAKLSGTISNGEWKINLNDGTMTIGKLSASSLTSGTIDASTITVNNINASKITSGTLNANRIGANSISVAKLTGNITNGEWKINLNDGTLTIGKLSANSLTAGTIDANTITITNLNADNITSGTISANRIQGGNLTINADAGSTRTKAIIVTKNDKEYLSISPGNGISVGRTTNRTNITDSGISLGEYYAGALDSGIITISATNKKITVGNNSNAKTEILNGGVSIVNNQNRDGISIQMKTGTSSNAGIKIEANSDSYNAINVVKGKTALRETSATSLAVGSLSVDGDAYSEKTIKYVGTNSSTWTDPKLTELKKVSVSKTLYALTKQPSMHSDGNGGYSFSTSISSSDWQKIELSEASYNTKVYAFEAPSSVVQLEMKDATVLAQ